MSNPKNVSQIVAAPPGWRFKDYKTQRTSPVVAWVLVEDRDDNYSHCVLPVITDDGSWPEITEEEGDLLPPGVAALLPDGDGH